MRSVADIQSLQSTSSNLLARMEKRVADLNALVEKLEADTSRSRQYTLEVVKTARAEAWPALDADLQAIRELAAKGEIERPFWSNATFLLQRQKFASDDAAQHAKWHAELAGAPDPLLRLAFDSARLDGDLAMVWLAFAEASRRGVVLDLAGVVVPGQTEAMAAINELEYNERSAEMQTLAASGQTIDPIRKMNLARSRLTGLADARVSV